MNALVDDLRGTIKTELDALCCANQKEVKSHV